MFRRITGYLSDGQCTASERAIADAIENFIPGNADRAFAIEFVEPSVELLFLSIGHWNRFRGQAIPELFEQVQAFFWAQLGVRLSCGLGSRRERLVSRRAFRLAPSSARC